MPTDFNAAIFDAIASENVHLKRNESESVTRSMLDLACQFVDIYTRLHSCDLDFYLYIKAIVVTRKGGGGVSQ